MDIKKLRYFKAATKELHFGKATEKLYVAPSSKMQELCSIYSTLVTRERRELN